MSPVLLAMVDDARTLAGVPFNVTSGYRCIAYNEECGYSPTSSHLAGLAVDIACSDSRIRMRILLGAVEAGFRRIGIREDFIHLDCDPKKAAEVCWLY